MKVTKGNYGPMVALQVGRRSLRTLEISTSLEDRTINVPASGEITIAYAKELARAILLAADIAAGDIEVTS